jgi:hypothetical protein
MAAIYSNGGNRWNILGFNFTKRDVLSSVYKTWPEMEDIKRSGVRAHVFLIIQCTIQISGSVWQIQNGCLFLVIFTIIAQ